MTVRNPIKSGLGAMMRLKNRPALNLCRNTYPGSHVIELANGFSSSEALYIKTKRQRKEIERQKEKAYKIKKQTKEETESRKKPDPILGYSTRMNKDYLRWEKCELNKLILKNEDVWSGKLMNSAQDGSSSSSSENLYLNFGLNENQRLILFEGLPHMKNILEFKNQPISNTLDSTSDPLRNHQDTNQDLDSDQVEKKNKLLRIFDLRNSNSKGIDKFVKERIVKFFSPADPNQPIKLDPGCSEVQAAITTYRIHAVLKHAWANQRDKDSKRHLSDLVMKRMKILKYLRRTSPKRYFDLLPRIGLEPKYLNDELIVRAKLPPRPGELSE